MCVWTTCYRPDHAVLSAGCLLSPLVDILAAAERRAKIEASLVGPLPGIGGHVDLTGLAIKRERDRTVSPRRLAQLSMV